MTPCVTRRGRWAWTLQQRCGAPRYGPRRVLCCPPRDRPRGVRSPMPPSDQAASAPVGSQRRRHTGRQLALELPSELPPIAIPAEWKTQQRLWGHAFHPMCSYLASFPAALAHAFIARYSRPGDVVLDPFSGRGTTPLQAAAEGRIGVGNDLNPFAHLLTAAKLDPPTVADARTRAVALRLAWGAEAPAWLELAGRVVDHAPDAPIALVPAAGGGAGPADGTDPVPPEVALAFHPR